MKSLSPDPFIYERFPATMKYKQTYTCILYNKSHNSN